MVGHPTGAEPAAHGPEPALRLGSVQRVPIRLENVGIAVRDLEATIAFFIDLGLTVLGRDTVSGDWADTAVGLDGNHANIAMLQTLRAAAEAPRTIELYSQSVRYSSRWPTDRGGEPLLDELTRHAIAEWLAELADTCEPSTVGTRLLSEPRLGPAILDS